MEPSRVAPATAPDGLSGLSERQVVREALAQRMATVHGTWAVVALDVDGTTLLNARRGRGVGSTVLATLEARLGADAGGRGAVGRVGGDSFLAILPLVDAAGLAEAVTWARRPLPVPGSPEEQVTISAGAVAVSTTPSGPVTDAHRALAEMVVEDAELALHDARQARRPMVLHDIGRRATVLAAAARTAELRAAVRHGEFVAHFQRVVDPTSLEVVGLEALARWRRAGGLLDPAEWLPAAERAGLLGEIGWQVMAQARAASDRTGLPVAVNVTAEQLEDPAAHARLAAAWGTDAYDRLTLEVTEGALHEGADRVVTLLSDLAERGVRVAIDDFGTGYSSLARLGSLPVHVLKVDRSFVAAMGTRTGDASVYAVLDLARAFGLSVVAEGVEEPAQLRALADLGVRAVQGFLVGRPQLLSLHGRHRATAADRWPGVHGGPGADPGRRAESPTGPAEPLGPRPAAARARVGRRARPERAVVPPAGALSPAASA